MNLSEFTAQCILISGANSGIGAQLTEQLLRQGSRLIGLDQKTEQLEKLASQYPGQLLAYAVDVSDYQAVEQAVRQAQASLGPIDKLVCVAGILQMGKLWELSPEQWERTFAVNTQGVFNVCKAVVPCMIERLQGAIVNVSSNAATTPRASMGAYAASKAAVTQLSRCLGLELAEYGIRVNIVSPGSTDTAMQQAMWAQGSSREAVIAGAPEQFRLGIPLARIATPEDITQSILFLLSEQARHITLHDLRVDGGATLDQ